MLTQLRSSKVYERITRREIVKQFIKYGVVGVVNVITFFSLFNLFLFAGLPALGAYVLAFVPSNINSFFLNKRWAFRDERSQAVGRQYVGFALVTAVALGINAGLFSLFLIPLRRYGTLGENLAALAPLPASVAWNFLTYRYWTFRRGHQGSAAD